MNSAGFEQFLIERNLDQQTIRDSLTTVEHFNEFLKKQSRDIDDTTRGDFYGYSEQLIRTGGNTRDTYVALVRYGHFINNKNLIIAGMEVLDGREVFTNLYNRLKDEYGEDVRDRVFKEVAIPQLGLRPEQKPDYTRKIVSRLEREFGAETCREFLNRGLRDRYEEWRKPDRDHYLTCANIDEFLAWRRKTFIEELTEHYTNRTLFFTQEITKQVLDHVIQDPRIEVGVREGNDLRITKIPYNADAYLKETDQRKKRYHYCHCPWARESLLQRGKPIPPVFCNCSAGYYRAYWEIVLDRTVSVEVVDSVLRGDLQCTFIAHL